MLDAQVIPFSPPDARPLADPPPAAEAALSPADRRSVDIHWWARALKMEGRPLRAVIATVRMLIEHSGAPAPRTPRFVKGRRLTGGAAVTCHSRWDRDEAELWLDHDGGDTPPAAAARAQRRERVRADLAANALRLARTA